MEVDGENEPLRKIASGDLVAAESWPGLRDDIVARLEKIAHGVFPIPNLPPPTPRPRLLSPLASSPPGQSSHEADGKDRAAARSAPASPGPDDLPRQIAQQLSGIKSKLETFSADAPHTIQRLAELVLQPRAHYRALATYLHAVDRVVQVTSGAGAYPLPPAVPDMSAINGGEEAKDPAETVAWSNPTTAPLGSDEALGGALLTPIPWLTRTSPDDSDDGPGAQIHSEGTETIEGPNGVGSIETVSVSVNGVPSTGHARGVTQGELLRQEQRAGVVPVNQLPRGQEAPDDVDEQDGADDGCAAAPDDADEIPHARGPDEIGVGDTGPQGEPVSYFGQDGVQTQDINVEAAVGRRHADTEDAHAPTPDTLRDDGDGNGDDGAGAGGPRAKREAVEGLEAEAPKRPRESRADDDDATLARSDSPAPGSPATAAPDDDDDDDDAGHGPAVDAMET